MHTRIISAEDFDGEYVLFTFNLPVAVVNDGTIDNGTLQVFDSGENSFFDASTHAEEVSSHQIKVGYNSNRPLAGLPWRMIGAPSGLGFVRPPLLNQYGSIEAGL